jgi:hypothetical protein
MAISLSKTRCSFEWHLLQVMVSPQVIKVPSAPRGNASAGTYQRSNTFYSFMLWQAALPLLFKIEHLLARCPLHGLPWNEYDEGAQGWLGLIVQDNAKK